MEIGYIFCGKDLNIGQRVCVDWRHGTLIRVIGFFFLYSVPQVEYNAKDESFLRIGGYWLLTADGEVSINIWTLGVIEWSWLLCFKEGIRNQNGSIYWFYNHILFRSDSWRNQKNSASNQTELIGIPLYLQNIRRPLHLFIQCDDMVNLHFHCWTMDRTRRVSSLDFFVVVGDMGAMCLIRSLSMTTQKGECTLQ